MSRTGNELREPARPARRAWMAAAAAAATAALLTAAAIASPAQTQPAPTAAASAAATDPIDTIPTSAPWTTSQPIRPAKTVDQALAYTDQERIAFDDVRDGDGQLDGVALSILLRHAAMLPAGRDVRKDADRPSPRNLYRRPGDYRGRLIAVEGLFVGTMDISNSVAPTAFYAGPVHAMVLQEESTGRHRPILVVMPQAPPARRRGAKVSVAGLFYKVARLPVGDDGDNKTADYAVVVARGMYRPAGGAGVDIPAPMKILAAVIVVLLMLFVLVWRRTRSGPTRKAGYKPLRFEDAAEAPPERSPEPEEPEESGEVDEDLIRQAEEFKRRKHHREGEQ